MSGYYNRNNRGITKKLGPVTAYADAVLAGYKGTREQWAQDMAKLGQNVTQVAQNTELTTELAEQTRENTEQVAKDTADVRRLADETSDNAVQVASNTAESNRLAKETKQAAAQAKEDAEYAGAAADNFRVDTTLSEAGKAAEAKATGEKFAQLSEENVNLCAFIIGNHEPFYPNFDLSTNTLVFPADTGIVAHDGSVITLDETNNTCSFSAGNGYNFAVKFCYVKASNKIVCYRFNDNTPATTHILLATARMKGDLDTFTITDVVASMNCEYLINGSVSDQWTHDRCFAKGWEDVTALMGEPLPSTSYSDTHGGFFEQADRSALVGLLTRTILRGTNKLRISAPNGVKYARQIFSSTVILKNASKYELYNDSSWQTGVTELDLTQFENPVTFSVLFYDGNNPNNKDVKIEIYGENVVSIQTVYNELNGLKGESGGLSDYIGEPIQINPKYSHRLAHTFDVTATALPVARTGPVQCFAFYNSDIIACFINGGIAIYNADYTLKKEYALSGVGSDFHAANCFLYGDNPNSDYPYLYVSETTGNRRCAIVSLEENQAVIVGWLSYDGEFGAGKVHYDWIFDEITNHIFLVGYDDYSRNNFHIIIKDLGVIKTVATYTYTNNDVISTKHDYHMSILQGGHFSNGRMFYAGYGVYGEGIYAYDMYSSEPFKSFVPTPHPAESEGCCVKDGEIYYLFADGEFYALNFK